MTKRKTEPCGDCIPRLKVKHRRPRSTVYICTRCYTEYTISKCRAIPSIINSKRFFKEKAT